MTKRANKRPAQDVSDRVRWACQVVIMAIADVHPRAGNPRTHAPRQLRQIMRSIEKFGFLVPILIDVNGYIICGHARYEAAKRLGFKTIPVIVCDTLSDAEIRAFVIADNKLCENGGWDPERLAQEFRYFVEIDFEPEITGFETAEIDLQIQQHVGGFDADEADEVPDPEPGAPVVARRGDLWRLGNHRLYCGDATLPESYEILLAGSRAQMVFTDPPFNVPIKGHISGLGRAQHREFAMASGEMSEEEFIEFLRTIARHLITYSVDGAIAFICMDWRHAHQLLTACRGTFAELKNICVWAKANGGMGSLYRSRHELVFVFKNGTAPHINNVELGRFGRYRSNLWQYPGMNSFGAERDEALATHPTVKPVALVADAILDVSKRGGLVLDPFSGSGTIILAAEKTGRRAAAIEIDPVYVDATIRRFQKHVRKPVTHAETGQTFEEIRSERAADQEDE